MKTQEYIDAQRNYLNRLKNLRQREKAHLSDVDFALFSSRFDVLISDAEEELQNLEAAEIGLRDVHTICLRAILSNMAHCGSLNLGSHAKVIDCHATLKHYAFGRLSVFGRPESYPRQMLLSSVAVRNDEGTLRNAAEFPAALPPVALPA